MNFYSMIFAMLNFLTIYSILTKFTLTFICSSQDRTFTCTLFMPYAIFDSIHTEVTPFDPTAFILGHYSLLLSFLNFSIFNPWVDRSPYWISKINILNLNLER